MPVRDRHKLHHRSQPKRVDQDRHLMSPPASIPKILFVLLDHAGFLAPD